MNSQPMSVFGGTAHPARSGFSLVELMISLTVLGIIITGALGFMSAQSGAFRSGVDRVTALASLRFSIQTLELDIRTLGTGVPTGQPPLVYAGSDVIAFHADYVSNLPGDLTAVYVDPDAPPGQVSAPNPFFTLPETSFTYPDTLYEAAPGIPSPAELIIFFFKEDDTTSRSDDFVLYRQVNANDPELVARNLLRVDSEPFFRYLLQTDSGAVPVPDSWPPMAHSVPIHLSPADTGVAARIDSVRAVRITVGATNGKEGEDEATISLTRLVPFPNYGLTVLRTCGSSPILGVSLTASLVVSGTGEPSIHLTWPAAVDEEGGEDDVIRYTIWRREIPGTGWSDPYLSIPAGAAPYSYEDVAVTPGTIYEYGLAAQDCTPSLSSMTVSTAVTVPST
jgi:prepilin-type N-terminal cleavage/methylation domain-containing protein